MGAPEGSIEKALRDSEERLRTLEQLFELFLEHSPFYFFFKDAELRPILLSRNFELMLGRPMDQILGRTMDELFPPELAKGMIEDDLRTLRDGVVVRVEEELGGRSFSTIKFPVKQEGKPTFLAGLTLDVTDQKKSEEALRRSEAQLRSFFQATFEGIAIHELVYDGECHPCDYRIVDVNPAYEKHTGLSAQESKGRLASELYGLKPPPYLEAYSDVAAGGPSRVFSAYFAPLGRYFRIGVFSPQPGTFATVFEDVTEQINNEAERKRLEGEFQHMQQLESLGSLAGGVAHDMNNVLQAIQGMASVLKAKCAGDQALGSGLDLILNASNRGRDLVRNLTDFARKGIPEASLLDLNKVVRREVDLLQHTTLQRIELKMELEEGLPRISGDPSSIGNALMNLCVNAIDAMPERGTLCFSTRTLAGGGVEILVEDSGEGMSPEVLARATEPFFTTKPRGKGTGLGLSGVYGTMKAHGGSMVVESEVGRGTRVFLRFPPSSISASPAAVPAFEGVTGLASRKSLRILLVDDDELIRATFPEYLEILGHQVLATAADGSHGLHLIEDGLDVDVVVLDQNMPGLSGMETLDRLRILRPSLPIVFCSGHLEDAVKRQLKGSSGVWILMKPYGIKDIQDILEAVSATLMTQS
ncbi:MAG: putative multi-sensor signal transduction histidine kinase [Holophagaceae bacterium]|nr:putative multi-sensor signal transduction histidine kinase [Holophagaceae bacterium]